MDLYLLPVICLVFFERKQTKDCCNFEDTERTPSSPNPTTLGTAIMHAPINGPIYPPLKA